VEFVITAPFLLLLLLAGVEFRACVRPVRNAPHSIRAVPLRVG
jgi:hypothetical protein